MALRVPRSDEFAVADPEATTVTTLANLHKLCLRATAKGTSADEAQSQMF